MHTLVVIGYGLCLLGLCLLVGHGVGRLRSSSPASSSPASSSPASSSPASSSPVLGRAALVFLPLWSIGAGINMWIGVTRAGYSVADEAPIFLIVFGVPAAIALLVWWKLSRAIH
jgi:hypothetical protein